MTSPHDPYRNYGPSDDDPRQSGNIYGQPQQPYGSPQSGPPAGYGHQPPQQPSWGPGQQQPHGQPAYGQPQQTYQQPAYGAGVGPGGYGPPPKKKSNAGKVIGIIAAVIVGVCVLGSIVGALNGGDEPTTIVDAAATSSGTPAAAPANDAQPSAAEPTQAEAPSDDITYKITGSGSAMITYLDEDFQISQTTKPLPWSTTVPGPGAPGMNINAQRKSGDDGEISCQILRGDEVVAENSSSGPYVVVSCLMK